MFGRRKSLIERDKYLNKGPVENSAICIFWYANRIMEKCLIQSSHFGMSTTKYPASSCVKSV